MALIQVNCSRYRLCLLLGWILCLPAFVAAQPAPKGRELRLSVELLGGGERPDAPVFVRASFENSGAPLQGRLDVMLLWEGRRSLGRSLSPRLSVPAGKSSFDLLLPRRFGSEFVGRGVHEVRCAFLPLEGESIKLGQKVLQAPSTSMRFGYRVSVPRFWVARSIGGLGNSDHEIEFAEGWRRHAAKPAPTQQWQRRGANGLSRELKMADLEASEFPRQVVGYCCYDFVLLGSSTFAALDDTQLRALEGWIYAGGKACIIVGTLVRDSHVKMLQRISEASHVESSAPLLVRGVSGIWSWGSGWPASGQRLWRPGLGTLALLTEDAPSLDPTHLDFLAVSEFLELRYDSSQSTGTHSVSVLLNQFPGVRFPEFSSLGILLICFVFLFFVGHF